MFFRQLITPGRSFTLAGHMVTSEDADTPDVDHDHWGFLALNF